MDNLEYLKGLSKYPSDDKERMDRMMKALEIIAEESIKQNVYFNKWFTHIKLKGVKVAVI